MARFPEIRRKLQIAFAVLVGLNMLALGALVYMMVRGTSLLPAEFNSLHQQVLNKKPVIVPPKTVEDRIKEAREQIAHFYEDRIPSSSAAIFETLGKVANENNVRLNQASYKSEAVEEMPGLQQVSITASLNGNYAEAMKFINALEREKTFFIVNSVSLGGQQGGNVHLNISIETYLRGQS
jgi:type IV pilus assembly protein PilO